MSDQDMFRQIHGFLKSCDIDTLNDLLGKILSELRSRENEQMQVDVITHSQRLRLKNLIK